VSRRFISHVFLIFLQVSNQEHLWHAAGDAYTPIFGQAMCRSFGNAVLTSESSLLTILGFVYDLKSLIFLFVLTLIDLSYIDRRTEFSSPQWREMMILYLDKKLEQRVDSDFKRLCPICQSCISTACILITFSYASNPTELLILNYKTD
jgi:hypothetical protein